MIDLMHPGEIVYCTMICSRKKGENIKLGPFVFSCDYSGFKNDLSYSNSDDKRTIDKFKLQEDITIVSLTIHNRLGFKNKSKSFTEVKASDEKRNNITGAYE